MTTKGRRPKPTAVKELDGNPGRRPLNAAEPKPPRSSGRVPRGMDEAAAAIWREVVTPMTRLGVITQADHLMAEFLVKHAAIALRAYDELQEEGQGLTLETRDGEKKNPRLQIFRDNSLAARQYMTECGLTPAARSKIATDNEGQMSLAEILFGEAAQRVAEQAEAETSDV